MNKYKQNFKLITKIVSLLPPNLRDNIRGIKRFSLFNRKHTKKQLFIYFADGSTFHGGLTDRFKGIISTFLYCLTNDIQFKISYTSPFTLQDFIVRNEYNWELESDDQVSYNIFESKYMFIIGETAIQRLNALKSKKQIHCLANRDITTELQTGNEVIYTWGQLFSKLFKPAEGLKHKIENCQAIIGGKYFAIVFRFQNLLGDFEEYNKPALSKELQTELIEKCNNAIKKMKEQLSSKILITSDSEYFLDHIESQSDIYIFPEKVVHVDNVDNESTKVYLKSFMDFYLISDAAAIYSIGTSFMYDSDFPRYAAKLNNIPFERIVIR